MRGNGSDKEKQPFLRLLPNLVTIVGLCAGLTSIRFAIGGDYHFAAGLIVFAVVIDGLDGLLARRLRATSDLGAQLDSLSDFLNFGVAPGMLVFQSVLVDSGGIGWLFVLVYTISCCLRLARFNVTKAQETAGEQEPKRHFVGVPAPAGALLALLPVFLIFEGIVDPVMVRFPTAAWLGVVGAMMVSQLPTLSPRSVFIPRDKIVWILIATAIVTGGLLTRFWLSLILIDVAYILFMTRSFVVRTRKSRA